MNPRNPLSPGRGMTMRSRAMTTNVPVALGRVLIVSTLLTAPSMVTAEAPQQHLDDRAVKVIASEPLTSQQWGLADDSRVTLRQAIGLYTGTSKTSFQTERIP